MVCIAAFIILSVISIFVGFLSIFKRDIGARWWQVFKKAWDCVWKKVRLQKCQTSFKDDVKNTILKKVIIKRPDLVRPLSLAIEIASVLIVALTVWSIVEATKAGLSLWVFGTCNLSSPSSCTLGAEACSIDSVSPQGPLESAGRWFSEWGEIFAGIPDRLHSWSAQDYLVQPAFFENPDHAHLPLALDFFDPGCSACLQTYKNQLNSGFFDRYHVAFIPFAIKLPDGSYKFKNSILVTRYLHALSVKHPSVASRLLHRFFTESDSNQINYQSLFLQQLSETQASDLIELWLTEFGLNSAEIQELSKLAHSQEVTEKLEKINQLITSKLRAKTIPVTIFNNQKHTGLFK